MVAAKTTTVSTRLRRCMRAHDEYVVRVGSHRRRRRRLLATVTAHPGVARRWVHTTLWRHARRLRSGDGITVGMGVQWTPPFRAPAAAARRPCTLQLCVGHRCLVFQLARAGAVPAVLRRFMADARAAFVAHNVRHDCRKLEEHHGLEVARGVELRRLVAGMGNASMERMAEEHLGLVGVWKPRRVGTSRWHARRLTKGQVEYACVDACLSFHLGVHLDAGDI
ncbi:uncharacterized protein LOC127779230 [Oryza glaberrima]|nr:uncharacterized protein LOC127779230 [Oryza glaberrima]